MRKAILLLLYCSLGAVFAFKCSPDSVLTWASEKRAKQLERECHLDGEGEQCATKEDLEKAWSEFAEISQKYEKAVKECRATVASRHQKRHVHGNRHKRSASKDDGDSDEKNSGDCEGGSCSIDLSRRRRSHSQGHVDGEEAVYSHTSRHALRHKRECGCKLRALRMQEERRAAEEKRKATEEEEESEEKKEKEEEVDDKEEENEQHRQAHSSDGHSHKSSSRHQPDDPMDDSVDHEGHLHTRRSAADHDPNDPNIDHTGHNHRRRSAADHDPNDPNIDHTGHNHRRRHADHDPTDPNIDHTGHNHRRRRHKHVEKREEEEGEEHRHGDPQHFKRNRRQTCLSKGREELERLGKKYEKHCERENICLPDEDLPAAEAEKFKKLHGDRAKKYAKYIGALSLCYGRLQ